MIFVLPIENAYIWENYRGHFKEKHALYFLSLLTELSK